MDNYPLEDIPTTSKIAKILEMLNDGQWYTIKELQQGMQLNENQLQQIIAFLKEYSFIVIDEMKKRIKLEENARKFLTQTAT